MLHNKISKESFNPTLGNIMNADNLREVDLFKAKIDSKTLLPKK